MTWRVGAKPAGPMSGPELLVHVINCQRLYRALTKPQRAHLLNPDQRADPRVIAALQAHGLVGEDGALTDAGAEIRAWNLPDERKEAA